MKHSDTGHRQATVIIIHETRKDSMDDQNDLLRIHVNIDIKPAILQAIVANAKKTATKRENGSYHIDTADMVSLLVTRFLQENDFDSFARDIRNYRFA